MWVQKKIFFNKKNITKYLIGITFLLIMGWWTFKTMKICFSFPLGIPIAAFIFLIWGLFVAQQITPVIANFWGDMFFAPRAKLELPPEILSPIKGMIVNDEFSEAIRELNNLLARKPYQPEAYYMLVEIYENNIHNSTLALEMIENYFAQKKVDYSNENIEMLLLYADICENENYLVKAEELLNHEIKNKIYSDAEKKTIQMRLENIGKNPNFETQ